MVEVTFYWLSQHALDQGLAPFYGGKNRDLAHPPGSFPGTLNLYDINMSSQAFMNAILLH